MEDPSSIVTSIKMVRSHHEDGLVNSDSIANSNVENNKFNIFFINPLIRQWNRLEILLENFFLRLYVDSHEKFTAMRSDETTLYVRQGDNPVGKYVQ